MKWWKRALLVSVLWVALAIGGWIFLTQIAFAGKVNAEQGRVIGETLGMACGFGLGFIWLACAVFRKKPPGG
jgi:hypothetical protein